MLAPLPTTVGVASNGTHAAVNKLQFQNADVVAGTSAVATPSGASDSAIASSCLNNDISTITESWQSFTVMEYMTSLLSAAPPSATVDGAVDGVMLMHDDVNPPGAVCTYTSKCDAIGCTQVKDWDNGSDLTVQRFLAYTAMVNLNNYLYNIYFSLLDSGTIGGLVSGNIVTVFFTNPSPSATWIQIMGTVTPLLGLGSAILGPLSAAISPVLGALSAIFSFITAFATANSIGPVVDQRFSEYSTITDFIGNYLKGTSTGVEAAFNSTIGSNSSIAEWTELFTGGFWVQSDYTQGLETGILDNFVKIFTYKAINFAWIDSGVFIMYVPYGVAIKDTNGNVQQQGIDQDYCQSSLKDTDNLGTLTICDAPGGMARIFNAGVINPDQNLMPTTPQGWSEPFSVLPSEPFNITSAIKGSVASWQVGDFNYDAASQYQDAFSSGQPLTSDLVKALQALDIAPETAGFFNIPVCATYDLRFFPPAASSGGPGCEYLVALNVQGEAALTITVSCNACGQGLGGKPGSSAKFWDNANEIVQAALTAPPPCTQAYETTVCVQICPSDPYGPTSAQNVAGGYAPGWCGVHVIQYQLNQGPGTDTSHYRLTVTIFDSNQVEISTSNDTVVESPRGAWTPFYSRGGR
ncbi:hypothetical protein HO133_001990 [Letharia lupina]|uniref:Uncharacterized protein n=1 Tax=Letharia lupina TaxID=560253 RepID=A0A8H6FB66_9LECA|nr:uncharacterized protein HO133_001990 [Letharia lupina]KAF6222022.1 hypothetical protein HO133_001990 [Letharia lupina]